MLRFSRLFSVLLIAYISISYVFWLPGASPGLFEQFKYAVLSGAVLCYLATLATEFNVFPVARLLILTMAVFFLPALAGLAQSTEAGALSYARDVSYPIIFVAFGYCYSKVNDGNRMLFEWFIWIASALSIATVLLTSVGSSYYASFGSIVTSQVISGFGSLRTGWSNGLAIPLAIALTLFLVEEKYTRSLLFLLLAFLICASQVMVAGRAGIVSPFIAIFLSALFVRRLSKIRLLFLFGMVLVFFVLVHLFYRDISDIMRYSSSGYGDDLDAISSGRLDLVDRAFDLISNRPLSGYGFDIWIDVHNELLKYMIQGGVVFGLACVAFWSFILAEAIRYDNKAAGLVNVAVTPALLTGLIVAQFEPHMLIGAFQIAAIWWASVGVVFGSIDKSRMRRAATGQRKVIRDAQSVWRSS